MAGYTRQSTFADGDTITAALFNNEYNQLLNAFSNTSGHSHDGTANEGPVIGLIGDAGETAPNNKVLIDTTNNYIEFYVQVSGSPVQQMYIADGAIIPVTDSDIDLGTSSLQFKDLYINGTANIDSLVLATGSTVTAVLDEDDLSSDSATSLVTQQSVKAYIDAQVTAQDLDFLGDSGGALSIDLDSESLTIAGGTGIDTSGATNTLTVAIDSTVATLTDSQTLTNKTIDVDNNTVSNIEVDNFKASAIVLESEGIGSNDNDTSLPTSAAVKDYVDTQITAEDLDITTDSGTIAIDLDSETLTVSGGTGLDSSATGNAVTLAIDSTVTTLTGSQTLTNKTLTSPDVNTPDIDGGTIDGATIATSDVTVGAGKTLDVSAGTITLADNQISGDKVEGGTIAATTITDLTFGSLNDGTITATAFVDEDNMASNSATLIPTQQSVKAYVDTTVAATNEVVEDSTPQLGGDLDLNSSDITGTGNINITGTIQSSGNITGTLATAAQTNITSVGALDGGSITSGFGSIDVGSSAITTTGTITGDVTGDLTGTVLTAAQPNITSLGSLTGLTTTGDINFGDNDKAVFGADSDLQIYHTGTESWIKDAGTGNFYIDSNGAAIQLTANGAAENMLNAVPNGGITLYHDNAIKLNTTSTGIDVTGTVTNDGLIVDGNNDIQINRDGVSAAKIFWDRSGTTDAKIELAADENLNISVDEAQLGGKSLIFRNNASEAMRIDSSGRLLVGNSQTPASSEIKQTLVRAGSSYLEFQNTSTNTGSTIGTTGENLIVYTNSGALGSEVYTERMRIDSSGNVGIGYTAPNGKLNVNGRASINCNWAYNDAFIVQATQANSTTIGAYRTDGTTPILIAREDGNVGIGTSSPASTISGSAAVLHLYDGTNNNLASLALQAGTVGSKWEIGALSSNALGFFDDGTERMRIDYSGNVGIGASSLTRQLQLYKSSNSAYSSSSMETTNLQLYIRNADTTVNNHVGLQFSVGNNSDAAIAGVRTSDANAALTFGTRGTGSGNIIERMRITSNGFTKHSNTGTYDTYTGADDSHQFVSDNASHSTLWVTNTNTNYATGMLRLESARGASSAFNFLAATSGNLTDDQFLLRGDGNAYADGSWNGGGADYAEYFEWSDGNTDNEDRRGYTVVLAENKIRKSTSEDNPNNIIGVVSGNPSVIGDSDIGSWKNKYQKDDYGSYIKDENGDRVINDEYDETQDYVSREDRQEWDIIGLMGKVRINTGQTVGDRWIKMRNISDTIEEWLIK